jgi:O-methyltransferase
MTQTIGEKDWAAADGLKGALLPPVRMHLANAIKSIAFHSGLHRVLFYRYDYMFRPAQLAFLVESLTKTHGLTGPILEIGCAAGHSTVYLNKHLDDLGDTRDYVCIDTFCGFTEDDIAAEVDRGHESSRFEFLFRAYRKDWFDQTMRNNGITRVRSIEADVNDFDFSPYRDISFCLVDVDLMRPVARALDEVYPRMAPGGIIVVDDCAPDRKYEGAYAAYVDFVERIGAPVDVRYEKLGVITVEAAAEANRSSTAYERVPASTPIVTR